MSRGDLRARASAAQESLFVCTIAAHASRVAAAVLLFAAAAAAQSLPAARIRIRAPSATEFLVRATLPVPPGTFRPENGGSAFHIQNPDGTFAQAQTELVTRYPVSTDGADVVELLARVRRPSGAAPGAWIEYPVHREAHRNVTLTPTASITALLATPGAILARTRDAFGNTYSADLYEDVRVPGGDRFRVLRSGLTARTVVTHQFLAPTPSVSGPTGTLPHAMGVHAYFTLWSGEDFASLDLRVHNAASGADPTEPLDDALAKLYFEAFELRLPAGWVVLDAFPNPHLGAPVPDGTARVFPIVAPLSNGKLHVLPQMGQFHRRLVVARDDAATIARATAVLREEHLGFSTRGNPDAVRPLWSWWNPLTARYFPQRRRMPALDSIDADQERANHAATLTERMNQVATGSAGNWPATSAGLGWAHPWGVPDGGMVGGEEIWLYDGVATAWCASNAGYRLAQLRHRMYVDRQRNVLYNAAGAPTAVRNWTEEDLANGAWLPVWWFNGPMLWAADPFGFGAAPSFQNTWVAQVGRAPTYESALLGYQSIDEAHLGRFTHDAKVLVWLGNDALAKDELRAQAESFRLGYSELPQDVWGATIVSGLKASEDYVSSVPGNGFAFGRREGWCLDAVCAAYSFAEPSYRARTGPWLERVVEVLEAGQSTCTGTIQATLLSNVFNAQYRCRQSIEAAIGEHALVALRESVFGRANVAASQRLNGVLERSTRAMISSLYWSSAGRAPWSLIAVGPANSTLPLFCNSIPADGNSGHVDAYQCWSSFAYGYELTGDPAFLARAEEMLGDDLRTGLQEHALENLQNRTALLELVQRLQ